MLAFDACACRWIASIYQHVAVVLIAQATAVSFGSYHTSALLIQQEDSSPSTSGRAPEKHHSLYTFGRGVLQFMIAIVLRCRF